MQESHMHVCYLRTAILLGFLACLLGQLVALSGQQTKLWSRISLQSVGRMIPYQLLRSDRPMTLQHVNPYPRWNLALSRIQTLESPVQQSCLRWAQDLLFGLCLKQNKGT